MQLTWLATMLKQIIANGCYNRLLSTSVMFLPEMVKTCSLYPTSYGSQMSCKLLLCMGLYVSYWTNVLYVV